LLWGSLEAQEIIGRPAFAEMYVDQKKIEGSFNESLHGNRLYVGVFVLGMMGFD